MTEPREGGRGSQNVVPEGPVPVGYESRPYTMADMSNVSATTCLDQAIVALSDKLAIQGYFNETGGDSALRWNERAVEYLTWLKGQAK